MTVVNDSASSIYHSDCFVLARLDARGWRQVVRSHAVNVACATSGGEVKDPHARRPAGLALYDDLRQGIYGITQYYRPAPKHWKVLKALTRRDRIARLQFTVGPAPVPPKPQLPEKRILRLAMTPNTAATPAERDPARRRHTVQCSPHRPGRSRVRLELVLPDRLRL